MEYTFDTLVANASPTRDDCDKQLCMLTPTFNSTSSTCMSLEMWEEAGLPRANAHKAQGEHANSKQEESSWGLNQELF